MLLALLLGQSRQLERRRAGIKKSREELLRKLLGLEERGIPYQRQGAPLFSEEDYAEDYDAEAEMRNQQPYREPVSWGYVKDIYRR